MNAILGKVTKVRQLRARRGGGAGRGHRLEVSFKPACVMPDRSKVPEWLKGQVLKVTREVADPREVGGVGDSIVLTPAESARWLFPLEVAPAIARGRVPRRLRLTLRWWKNRKPGEFTVRANGRRRSGTFAPAGKADRRFSATADTRGLFDGEPSLPVALEVSFDKLKVACTVLPAAAAGHCRLRGADGVRHRLEGRWYAVDVCTDGGGGISALRETAREVDHFRCDEDLIRRAFDYGGHADRVEIGWSNKMRGARMTIAAARREGGATRLCLEGTVGDAETRTTAAYTLFDELPLVLIRRDVLRDKPKKKDDDKKDEQKPAEEIDQVVRVELGFRAAFRVEPDAQPPSRILSVDGDRLAVLRHAQMHEWHWPRWRLKHGWAIMEHPARRECTMYLVDGSAGPVLKTWLGDSVVTLDARWLPQPVRPQRGAGFSVALCAGELCGAEPGGAWVALRRPGGGGGVRCAAVARFDEPPETPSAEFAVGRARARVPLERLALPGVGRVYVAEAHLPGGRMTGRFGAAVGGIAERSAR